MNLNDPRDLDRLGLVGDEANMTAIMFIDIWTKLDTNLKSPSQIVAEFWRQVEKSSVGNSTVGGLFEILIGVMLLRSGISPFYKQAEVSFVNNARFDFLLWEDAKFPIAVSVKTSLRERYKQAILESDALKSVHKWASSYVVTLSAGEVSTRRKSETKGGQHSSVDSYVIANQIEFDDWLEYLSEKSYGVPPLISPMSNDKRVQIYNQ